MRVLNRFCLENVHACLEVDRLVMELMIYYRLSSVKVKFLDIVEVVYCIKLLILNFHSS